ncbi:hypothetical protein [Enterovibrio calviensis]|uniref:hypothetical protein n=1 Tax=Enterovibrio calviensis TaxID=91359 RepID=UPI00048209DD|nr:hypothetical protein [Enterovibrio calviensis]
MHYQILSKDDIAEQLLSMEMVQDYTRVYDPQDEPLLKLYRSAAIQFAETYTNRVFGSASVAGSFDTFKKTVYLPLGNVVYVSQVMAYNGDTLEVLDGYRFNQVTKQLIFTKDYSKHSDFQVEFFVDSPLGVVAAPLIIGMLKLIATWFENREDISNGVSVAQVPMNHRYCFDLYRISPVG